MLKRWGGEKEILTPRGISHDGNTCTHISIRGTLITISTKSLKHKNKPSLMYTEKIKDETHNIRLVVVKKFALDKSSSE